MKRQGSYALDGFQNRAHEVSLLDLRASAAEQSVAQLKSMGVTLKKGMRILDVGSGTGAFALAFGRLVNKGEVVGIDTSLELLKAANKNKRKSGLTNVFFTEIDVMSHSSLKALGKFDFVFMRGVLQHLPKNVLALKNLRSVLKQRGQIFIEDPDRASIIIFPSPVGWELFHKKIMQGQSKKGGEPNTGRKIADLLFQAGFSKVTSFPELVFGQNEMILDWTKNRAPTYLNFLSPKDRRFGNQVLKKIADLSRKRPMQYCEIYFRAIGEK